MAIFQGTAKNKFTSFSESEGGGLTSELRKALGYVGSIFGKDKKFSESFVEDGSHEIPGLQANNAKYSGIKKPTRRAQFTQRPKATVFIKKKQFSSLKSNYETRFLDEDERLYLRCVKTLFKRKCDEISFYESLISFNSIYENEGFLNIDNLTDSVTEGFLGLLIDSLGLLNFTDITQATSDFVNVTGGLVSSETIFSENLNFLGDLYKLKKKNEMSKASAYTRWIENGVDYTGLGPGTGTIELNLVSSLRTSSTISSSGGSADITIEDPHHLFLITESDLEIAIRSTISASNGLVGFFAPNASVKLDLARSLDTRLNEARQTENLSPINFYFQDGEPVFEIVGVDYLPGDEDSNPPRPIINAPFSIINTDDFFVFKQILTSEEIGIINQILRLLKEWHADMLLAIDVFSNANGNTSELRRRMRRDFLGQYLVQPMDQVSIFATSNTQNITPANKSFGSAVSGLSSAIDSEKNMISLDLIEQERKDLCPSIPLPIYTSIRNRKIYRTDGNCIFTGLAGSISESYSASEGMFNITVSCESTMEYLKMGRFTNNPSLANVFGLVQDPLTPFKLEPDLTTGLVSSGLPMQLSDQNKLRLPYLYVYKGMNAGKKIKDEAQLIQDKEETYIIDHTPGLVYRWKEGIITATPQSSGPEILRGISSSAVGGQFGGFTPLANPFAGLDAANIASILICGQPYDYSTFMQATKSLGGMGGDSSNNTRLFFNALFDTIDRQNRFYGDFLPAKDSSISREAAMAASQIVRTIEGLNARIQKLLNERSQRQTALFAATPESRSIISNQIAEIDKAIAQTSAQVTANLSAIPSEINASIEGNDIVFSSAESQKEADNQLLYRLRRKPEDVRLNLDKNYFIVSSSYDTSSAVQAFLASLRGNDFDLYSAEYKQPFEVISSACSALDLEFFSDINGNIVLRPPQYNKIPLSLFMELLKSRGDNGKSVLPPFIGNLLSNQADNIKSQILDNELQIGKALYSTGQTSINIPGSSVQIIPLANVDDNGISSLNDAEITSLMNFVIDSSSTGKRVSLFGPADRANQIISLTSSQPSVDALTSLYKFILAQKIKLGKTLSDNLKAEASDEADEIFTELNTASSAVKINSAYTKLGSLYSQRLALVRSLASISKRYGEATATPGGAGIASMLTSFSPILSANLLLNGDVFSTDTSSISPLIKEIAEDDFNNIDGPGSSGRFIISDERIIGSNFTHTPPNATQITVSGGRNFISSDGSGQISGIPDIKAVATDFDMWKQYGFKEDMSKIRPDFTSSDFQCAPYAVTTLLRQRQNIHTGQITLIGNEWYKPGDNVYIQYRGLVYYVSSVSQSINLNSGSFSTTLNLTHGRPVGEYIPSPTDIAGTVLLKQTKESSKYRSTRSNTSQFSTIVKLGTANLTSYDILKSSTANNLDLVTQRVYEDCASSIRAAAATAIAKSSLSSEGYIEIRGYYTNFENMQYAQKFVDAITAKFIQEMSAINSSAVKVGLGVIGSASNTMPAIISNIYDITKDLTDDQRKVLPIPSEDAWLNPVSVEVEGNVIQLPLNAVDIVYVVNKSKGNVKK